MQRPHFDALLLIDNRTAVEAVERYCAFGTYLNARMRHAAPTAVRDHDLVLLAGVARELDHVDERRRVVGFLAGGSLDVVGQRRMLGSTAARQTHRQTQTFAYDSARSRKNIVADIAHLARHDVERQCFGCGGRSATQYGTPYGQPR